MRDHARRRRVIDDVPENEVDSSTLHAFVDDVLGGMQKDPCRDERNWKISKKDASSISSTRKRRTTTRPVGSPGAAHPLWS